jgi:hypothetical protein
MSALIPSRLLADALIRRTQAEGGFAMVLARGAEGAGAILVQTLDKGQFSGFFERIRDFDGATRLVRCGPAVGAPMADVDAYCARRRAFDPDLWIIELDVPEGERFAAETICGG